MEDRIKERILVKIVHTGFDVIDDAEIAEKTDILESSGNTGFVYVDSIHLFDILAVQIHLSSCRFVYFGKHIENGSLAGTVRTDQTDYFIRIYFHIQVVYGSKTAKIYTQIFDFKNRIHSLTSPFLKIFLLNFSIISFSFALLVICITTISTIAYISMR